MTNSEEETWAQGGEVCPTCGCIDCKHEVNDSEVLNRVKSEK